MYLSSTLCWAQEGYQRDRAANADLLNARVIAGAAATAWEREALLAEMREERKAAHARLSTHPALSVLPSDDELDLLCSENPDREFSNN